MVHHQQSILLQRDGLKETNPWRAFIKDIIKFINNLDDDPENSTILMDDSKGGSRKICDKTMLIDTFMIHMGEHGDIPAYSRGIKRIDYILISQNLLQNMTHVGYLPFFESNDGDHRGAFIDISNAILDAKVELKRPAKRMIGSSSKGREIFDYKKELNHQIETHKLYEKAEEAFISTFLPSIPKSLEKLLHNIDSQLTAFALRAEKLCCPKRYESEWSIALHHQSLPCRFWITR
jgi:hypothetical protein